MPGFSIVQGSLNSIGLPIAPICPLKRIPSTADFLARGALGGHLPHCSKEEGSTSGTALVSERPNPFGLSRAPVRAALAAYDSLLWRSRPWSAPVLGLRMLLARRPLRYDARRGRYVSAGGLPALERCLETVAATAKTDPAGAAKASVLRGRRSGLRQRPLSGPGGRCPSRDDGALHGRASHCRRSQPRRATAASGAGRHGRINGRGEESFMHIESAAEPLPPPQLDILLD